MVMNVELINTTTVNAMVIIQQIKLLYDELETVLSESEYPFDVGKIEVDIGKERVQFIFNEPEVNVVAYTEIQY